MRILRFLLQIVLLVLVGFFGWHYFTREELHSCVSLPLASLSGKTEAVNLDQDKINEFMANFGSGLTTVAQRSGNLWQSLQATAAATPEEKADQNLADQLLDKGKYLYCKTIVDQVETQ